MRLISLLFTVGLILGQDKQPTEKQDAPMESAIITVRTLTGDSFDRLLRLLDVFQARVKGDSQLRTIVVYAPKDVVVQMRKMVEQLDRPGSEAAIGRNIDMTLTLLRCSTGTAAKAGDLPLPADMESVARQLRAATPYKDIQLWDVIPMRVQEGKQSTESLRLPGTTTKAQFATTSITIRPEAVYRKDQGTYVRFAHLNLNFKVPIVTFSGTSANGVADTQFTYTNVGLETSGDFMEGQKTVLGKVSGTGEGDAIFVVVTLKILD
jgi:hypothetical protein